MLNFLKKKKDTENVFADVENADTGDEVKSLGSSDLGQQDIGGRADLFKTPDLGSSSGGLGSNQGVVTERDIQLIVTKMDLLDKKIEDIDKKIAEILEIAKQSK